MRSFVRPVLAALIGLSATLGMAPTLHAADLGGYSYDSGVCAESWVLNRVSSRFAYQVRHVPNLPQVGISDFHNIRETRYLPSQEDRPIGRRYCGATAVLSDGQSRDVWYLIEEGQGFAGMGGSNVEFCVSGFDRWLVFNGRCRVLR